MEMGEGARRRSMVWQRRWCNGDGTKGLKGDMVTKGEWWRLGEGGKGRGVMRSRSGW